MKKDKNEAENLAFDFCKTEMLEIFEKNEQETRKIYEALGVSLEQLDIWFEEIKNNQTLLTSTSRTLNVQILLQSSSSLQEFCAKIVLLYGFRENIIEATANVESFIKNKNLDKFL